MYLDPNAAFPYENLQEGEIRLITIRLGEDGALDLSLFHCNLNEEELKYDALTYAWNPTSEANIPPVKITCNRAPFCISYDLSKALKQLIVLKVFLVWVDFICINQNDSRDKEHQVPLMDQYYSKANMVWVWLGPSYGNSDHAMLRMSDLASRLPSFSVAQPATTQWLNQNGLPGRDDPFWEGIDSIFTREWFNRLWTMQEFALAQRSTFICGSLTATGAQVSSVATELMRLGLVALARKNRIPRVGFKDGYHFTTIASAYKKAKDENGYLPLHLAVQLGRFKEAKGSCAHDRIYALLGLLDPDVRDKIKVSYEQPWWDIYVHVGQISLKTSSHLEWLAQCQSTWRPIDLLPSWCGNFMAENEATPFIYDSYFAGSRNNYQNWNTSHIEFPIGCNNALLTNGIFVGSVTSVARLSEKWDVEKGLLHSSSDKFKYTLRWMSEGLEMARTIHGMSSSTVPEAYLRTLIADNLSDGSTDYTYEQLKEMWEAAHLLMIRIISNDRTVHLTTQTQNLGYKFLDSVWNACRFRRLFIVTDQQTREERLSLGPDQVQEGDRVVVLKSACMPFVLRENQEKDVYKMLGPAYVRGRMKGQIPELEAVNYNVNWNMVTIL
jgi:hypothetical protein